jgi:TolB-like protein/Tfp pilus assembly protein PilF
MATTLASAAAVCSTCGESLNTKGNCVACLLRTALDESVFEANSDASFVFGDFEIMRREDGSFCELGRGAMGITYLARDNVLRRKVALKVIDVPAAARGSQTVRERFLREARAAAALRHPNVAAVFQFGASPNGAHCYYAMELIEGETLETRVRRDGPLKTKMVLEIAIQISRALMAAAARSLIHRDLKPANIMLTRGDSETPELEVKVIDFGLAKAIADAGGEMDQTHEGFVGTPSFASPEQFEGGPVDVRSDVYSLGATLWFALTGKTPFAGRNIEDIQRVQKSNALPIEQLKAARVPPRFRWLLRSMLAIEPATRPGVKDLVADLRRCSAQVNSENIRRRIALAASLILIFGVTAFFVIPSLRTGYKPAVTAENSASNPRVPAKSIAILPFENASNEPNTEYLSEGISEALINSLSELQQLRVIARPTAFHYKGKDVDPRQAGRELGVAAVLTGTVRTMQDALNVQVDLIDAVTGVQIWGAGYDRKIADLVAVKQTIAQEVVAKLKLKLSGEEQRRLVRRDSTNAEAYQFYLRGRYFWNKRTSDGIKQAIEHFQQSIERDPNFALGYVGLADSYTGLAFYNFAAPRQAMPKAKQSAMKALALDDTLAEAHATLAHILINYDWDSSAAEKEFKRSIELNPEYATGHQWYAVHYLTATGRLEEAVQEMKKALELEPASLVMNTFMGATLYYAGRYDEAIDQCRRTIEMDPNFAVAHWHLGLAYEQKQLLDAATEEFKKAISLSGGSPLMRAALGRAYAESQKKDEASEMLNELNELAKRQYASAYELATICVALGNNEQGFQLLEKAYAEHSFHLVNLNVSPQFKSVRSDPRFQDLVHRLGLSPAPEKRIAVLPFENLSNDREDAAFADGVQDDILTKLARIADLKVISRTSVMQYRGNQNTHEIGDALRVSHVLEGSVRKTGAWLHVNAQLIDTRSDTHVWVEQYDRDLKDMFAIQSEIAQKVAERLHATITTPEKLAIERPPTADLTAFDLYNRAKTFLLTVINGSNTNAGEEDLLRAADLLNQAVAHDPTFFQAYCQLAWTHDYLYFHSFDRTPARLSLAEAAVQAAFRLRPNAGEAHLARAWNLYWGYRNYDAAVADLDIAGKTLPNDARLFELKGYIERRRPGGSQEEALRNLERAIELDPSNVHLITQTSTSYENLRRYRDDETILDRALAVDPNNLDARVSRAFVEFDWKADTTPLHQLIDELRMKDPAAIQSMADSWLLCALAERDPTSTANALAALGETSIGNETIKFHPRFIKGLIARMAKDDAKAHAAFTVAREEQVKLVRARPDDAGALCVLGLIDAALGRKEEALREGGRAVELLPVARDVIGGRRMIEYLAVIAAWVGDKDLACEQLGNAIRVPAPVTFGELKLLPFWDPLRGDLCFEQIVASLAPKEN